MLRNYVTVALRSLLRNKFFSAINIFGLGTAMAVCVTGYVNYQFSQSFDEAQAGDDRIFVVAGFRNFDSGRRDLFSCPTPLAPSMHDDIPGVRGFARIAANYGSVRYGERAFEEDFYYVDPDFFRLLTFNCLEGSLDALKQPDQVIITDRLAGRLFAEESAVGRQISITVDRQQQHDFVVGAVVTEPPLNSSFQFDLCLPYERQAEFYGYDLKSWTDWTSATLIQIGEAAPAVVVESRLDGYLEHTNEANPERGRDGYYLIPLSELTQHTREMGGPFREAMHPAAIVAPSVTALLVLLLACFNFMNTSIAFAARRINEIGVRKVMGGFRSQLTVQFVVENLVLCLAALVVGLALAEIMVPAYDALWPELALDVSYSADWRLAVFLAGLFIFTGIAAGLYPAHYISRLNPSRILRGRQRLGGPNTLTRVLLTLQLALSMTAIVAAGIMIKNADYLASLDQGYDGDNVLCVPIRGEDEYQRVRAAVQRHVAVDEIGVTQHLMGRYLELNYVEVEEATSVAWIFSWGEHCRSVLNFDLVAGRDLRAELASDAEDKALVNEMFVRQQGWESALDQTLRIGPEDEGREYRVVGVIRDFYPNGVNSLMRPTVVTLSPPQDYRYALIRGHPGHTASLFDYVEEQWTTLFPHLVFDGFWHASTMDSERQVNEAITLVFMYIAGMVILISSAGLLALVSLNLARRTKEIGIRRALGASIGNIGFLVSREFLLLLGIGAGLAVAMGYFLVDSLLSSIWAYYTDIGVAPFAFSVGLVLSISLLTVGYKVFAAACSNPVDALRHE